jgi:hypothetical protein
VAYQDSRIRGVKGPSEKQRKTQMSFNIIHLIPRILEPLLQNKIGEKPYFMIKQGEFFMENKKIHSIGDFL